MTAPIDYDALLAECEYYSRDQDAPLGMIETVDKAAAAIRALRAALAESEKERDMFCAMVADRTEEISNLEFQLTQAMAAQEKAKAVIKEMTDVPDGTFRHMYAITKVRLTNTDHELEEARRVIDEARRQVLVTDDLRETLSNLAHEQWSGWMRYMFEKGTHKDGEWIMPEWAVDRWSRQVSTPYADLSHDEQESDRKEADKFISAMLAAPVPAQPAAPVAQQISAQQLPDKLDCIAASIDGSGKCAGWVTDIRQAAAALRARAAPVAPATVAVPDVFCVGRAQYPARGGNVGLRWHVVGVADVPYRTCVPKDGELLFVLAASQREGVNS